MDSDETRRVIKFQQQAGIGKSLMKRAFTGLSMPAQIGPFEIAVGYLPLILVELALVIFPGFAGLFLFREWGWAPWYLHLVVIGTFLSGFIRKPGLENLKALAGLDPANLRRRYVPRDESSLNNPLIRRLVYLGTASLVGSFVSWFRFVSPLSCNETGVNCSLHIVVSFLVTWFGFVIPNFFLEWLKWFLATFVVLFLAERIPFTSWFLKRTQVLDIIMWTLWVLFFIVLIFWWGGVFKIAY